ncbi:MAG: hypothetical protein BWY71_01899 [Planctomycetes bacterium ADurb.Bin412]|nr:MAG: hypothetical protein BWY71_01899 [Planctomycetes bacterium ADurb.Bin412]
MYYRISPAFQKEHSDLWEYLSDGLKRLPTYQTDQKSYQAYHDTDPCGCDQK